VNKHTKEALFDKHLKIGWDRSEQSLSIFNFLYEAQKAIPDGSIVCDLGAGQSTLRPFFDHCTYVAVDSGVGDATWDYSGLDIVGDITRLEFLKDNSVDYCVNTVVLEHLKEPADFFAQVQRILKPGGSLFLFAPCYYNEHQIPHDFFRYTSYGLRHLCEKNGLVPVSVKPANKALSGLVRFVHLALNGLQISGRPWRVVRKCLSGTMKYFVVPLADYLDAKFDSTMSMPILWLLVAKKEGVAVASEQRSKPETLSSITRCPSCKGSLDVSSGAASCPTCNQAYGGAKHRFDFSARSGEESREEREISGST
jgi:SAM-dependent methyltransferase